MKADSSSITGKKKLSNDSDDKNRASKPESKPIMLSNSYYFCSEYELSCSEFSSSSSSSSESDSHTDVNDIWDKESDKDEGIMRSTPVRNGKRVTNIDLVTDFNPGAFITLRDSNDMKAIKIKTEPGLSTAVSSSSDNKVNDPLSKYDRYRQLGSDSIFISNPKLDPVNTKVGDQSKYNNVIDYESSGTDNYSDSDDDSGDPTRDFSSNVLHFNRSHNHDDDDLFIGMKPSITDSLLSAQFQAPNYQQSQGYLPTASNPSNQLNSQTHRSALNPLIKVKTEDRNLASSSGFSDGMPREGSRSGESTWNGSHLNPSQSSLDMFRVNTHKRFDLDDDIQGGSLLIWLILHDR
jgi:hypothetical protein